MKMISARCSTAWMASPPPSRASAEIGRPSRVGTRIAPPPLDAAAAYTLVRAGQPRHIVEVGSGRSTRFLARAMRDGEIDGRITAIDPQSGTEVIMVGAPGYGQEALKRLAARKLAYVIAKNRRQEREGRDGA